MCRIHADKALDVFCNTCNILVCAMCGILQHKTHNLTPVDQAAGVHRETIEALLAEVVVTRQESIVAATAVKIIRGKLEGNMKAALKVVNEGCNWLLRAVKQRRDELIALVNGAYHEKDDVYNKHITALEAIDEDSEAAVQLIEATLGKCKDQRNPRSPRATLNANASTSEISHTLFKALFLQSPLGLQPLSIIFGPHLCKQSRQVNVLHLVQF